MKEKIGMETLIELLNEYDNIKGDKEEPIYNWKIAIKTKIYQTYLVSARYEFIKRLVENDKINFKKFDGDNYDYLENPIGSNNYDTVWNYKTIIQWLSISDTPIDDLISYLK